MIITENKRSYCTAEQMEIVLVSTDELDFPAKFAIEYRYHVSLSSWVFVTMKREILCVNKAHPHAKQLAELAQRFMEITPEDKESDTLYFEIEKLAGTPAIHALCNIHLNWLTERNNYQNHLEAMDFVRSARTLLDDDAFILDANTGLLNEIRHLEKDDNEGLTLVFLCGYLRAKKEDE